MGHGSSQDTVMGEGIESNLVRGSRPSILNTFR